MRTAILYVFHQITPMVKYFDNLTFKKDGYDFIYIVNNKSISKDDLSKLNLVNVSNLYQRDNIGYDFGGWSDVIIDNGLDKQYDRFIFVNSSVYGPFVDNDLDVRNWCDIMLEGLTEEVKLYGSTVNGAFNFHVQSFAFCMYVDTLRYLIEKGIFRKGLNYKKIWDVIVNHELKMSQVILDKGWTIGSMCGTTKNVDFRKANKKKYCDIQYKRYLHNLLKPKEVMFIKGNRDIKFEDI